MYVMSVCIHCTDAFAYNMYSCIVIAILGVFFDHCYDGFSLSLVDICDWICQNPT